MRTAICGAAPVAPEVLEFMHALGIAVAEVWGMSECLVGTINPPGAIRIGTVGTAVPGVELKLAGDGELLVRGPTVMNGYRHDPVKTAEALGPGGWLRTGDLAAMDADGYVQITGRKKELIINAAGQNMSPSIIEVLSSPCTPRQAEGRAPTTCYSCYATSSPPSARDGASRGG